MTGLPRGGLQLHALAHNLASPRSQIAVGAAVLAPVILVSGWSTGAALQGSRYDPTQQTVSTLAAPSARYPWVMAGAIGTVALCLMIAALGLSPLRLRARVGLLIDGLTAIGIATFPMPTHGTSPIHLASAVVGGLTIAIWPTLAYFPSPKYPRILSKPVAVSIAITLTAILIWVLIETRPGSTTLGLAERVELFLATAWPSVVAVTISRGLAA
jgi:hypothetical protein